MNRFAAVPRPRARRASSCPGSCSSPSRRAAAWRGSRSTPTPRRERRSHARAAGLFATALARAFPNLPIEEEGRLQDARLRENFLERVFAYARLQELLERPLDAGRPDRLPLRPQDGVARALHRRLPRARPPGRAGKDARPRRAARALRGRVHGHARQADHAGPPRERADAPGRPPQRPARPRRQAGAARLD